MTAAANVLGKRPDGTVRRYGLQTQPTKLIHVLATKTGKLAYCGVSVQAAISVPIARARAIESRSDSSVQGFSFCHDCFAALTPQPDPSQWRPVPKNWVMPE